MFEVFAEHAQRLASPPLTGCFSSGDVFLTSRPTYVNTVIESGLELDCIDEFGAATDALSGPSQLSDDRHRPWFLLLSATKPTE